jgi:hypothetical protein
MEIWGVDADLSADADLSLSYIRHIQSLILNTMNMALGLCPDEW